MKWSKPWNYLGENVQVEEAATSKIEVSVCGMLEEQHRG